MTRLEEEASRWNISRINETNLEWRRIESLVTRVISITPAPAGIIELNEVSGSVETNSSSKRDPVPHPTRQFATTNPNPIFQSESITGWQWPGPSWLPKTSDPGAKSDGVISYTNGITRSNSTGWQKADKESRESGSRGRVSRCLSITFSPPPHVIRAIPSGRDTPRPGHRSSSPSRGLTTALLKSTLHDSRLLSSKTSKTGSRTASRGTSLDSLLFFGSNCNVICCFESIDYDISIMIFVRRSKSNQTILKSFLSIRNGVKLHSNRIHLGATFFERTLFGHEFPPISSIHRDEIDILCSPSWKAGQLSVTFSLSSSIHDNSESLHGDTNGVQLNSSRKRNLLLHDPNHQGFLNWPRSCCIIRSI